MYSMRQYDLLFRFVLFQFKWNTLWTARSDKAFPSLANCLQATNYLQHVARRGATRVELVQADRWRWQQLSCCLADEECKGAAATGAQSSAAAARLSQAQTSSILTTHLLYKVSIRRPTFRNIIYTIQLSTTLQSFIQCRIISDHFLQWQIVLGLFYSATKHSYTVRLLRLNGNVFHDRKGHSSFLLFCKIGTTPLLSPTVHT